MALKILFLLIFAPVLFERLICTFKPKEPQGKIRYKGLTYSLITTYSISVFLALVSFLVQEKTISIPLSLLGFVVAFFGVILRKRSIKTLGNNWSVQIKEIDGQQLIKNGPYHFIRHPYYLAVMFELLGIALFFNAFFAVLFILGVHLPILLFRLCLEEKVLTLQFKDEYLKYKSDTGMFLPLKILISVK